MPLRFLLFVCGRESRRVSGMRTDSMIGETWPRPGRDPRFLPGFSPWLIDPTRYPLLPINLIVVHERWPGNSPRFDDLMWRAKQPR